MNIIAALIAGFAGLAIIGGFAFFIAGASDVRPRGESPETIVAVVGSAGMLAIAIGVTGDAVLLIYLVINYFMNPSLS